MTFAMVLRSGGAYKPEHVHALVRGFRQHSAGDHRVVCLSDVPVEGVEVIPLKHGWKGWWSKIELFSPETFEKGERVFFADLDTVFTGDLSDILKCQEPFIAIGDFYRRPPRHHSIGIGSGLMMWTSGHCNKIYEKFVPQSRIVMRRLERPGDQYWIEEQKLNPTLWETVVSGQVVSYKVHCRSTNRAPRNARVVCFHGKPKPWEVKLRVA